MPFQLDHDIGRGRDRLERRVTDGAKRQERDGAALALDAVATAMAGVTPIASARTSRRIVLLVLVMSRIFRRLSDFLEDGLWPSLIEN